MLRGAARLDPEPDLDNANVGMSEKRYKLTQAASTKDTACVLFHVKRFLRQLPILTLKI